MIIVICDDEKKDAQIVRNHVERFGKEQNLEMELYEMNNLGSSADMIAFVRKHQVDAVFLDIDMPHISGDVVAEELSAECPSVAIIFFTNRDELVYDMIKYKPFRFIRKQRPQEIEDAMMALVQRMMVEGEILIEKGKNELVRVPVGDIRYVEVLKHQLVYHTDKEKIIARGSLTKCGGMLEDFGFLRTHMAYLVNIRCVKNIGRKEVLLQDDTEIPVGGSYRESMIRNYKKMLERIRYGQS